jgi:DNA helicase-4
VVFRTVHGSKGLEADYVFVLNNPAGRTGFPSRVSDVPAVYLLLSSSDAFPDAEERRLYYVALTRAREKVFLVTVKGKKSPFFDELHARWGEQMEAARFTCPECGGRLRVVEGPFGKFWGCENYRATGCDFKRNIVWKGQ